jgi:hypothetical protein
MEAHAETIRIPSSSTTKPLRRRLQLFRERAQIRRRERAIRTHGARLTSVPGSEHSHLVLPPKAY